MWLLTFFQLSRAAIKLLIVGAGVTGEAFHHHPEKKRSFSGANVSEGFRGFLIDLLNVCAIQFPPIIRLHHIKGAGIYFASGAADAVTVVFDDEQERQLFFLRETNGFEKIALPRCSIANR